MKIRSSEDNLRTFLITLASLATIGVINISLMVASVKASQKLQGILNSRELNLQSYVKTTLRTIKREAFEGTPSPILSTRIEDYRQVSFNID